MSQIAPCIGGMIAPPRIIMMRNADPWLVYLPSPAIAREKIHGHITEQKSPPLMKANIAVSPSVNVRVGIGICPFTAMALFDLPEKFTIVSVMYKSKRTVPGGVLFKIVLVTFGIAFGISMLSIFFNVSFMAPCLLTGNA